MGDPKHRSAGGDAPRRLARTTTVAVICIVWGVLGFLSSVYQTLGATVLRPWLQAQQAQSKAQFARMQQQQQQAAAKARSDEVAVLAADLAEATAAGDAAESARLEARIAVVESRPIPTVSVPGAELMGFQDAMAGPLMQAWQTVAAILGLAAYTLLIAAAVGLLQRQRWGRRIAMGTLAAIVVMGLTGSAGMCVAVNGVTDLSAAFRSPFGLILLGSLLFGFGCGVGLPAALLSVLLTHGVRDEFDQWDRYHVGAEPVVSE